MISKNEIEENLNVLHARYEAASEPIDTLFYSKLALLELCGWIEESMDELVLESAKRLLDEAENVKFIQNKVVKKTYGFQYENHFRGMLIQLIGLVRVEKIEKKVDPVKFAIFKATLDSLKAIRDAEAHTHIKGATKRINAPSVTIGQFHSVYDGLVEYESMIRSIRR